MGHTYYQQAVNYPNAETLTVGELIRRLQALDPAAPVIFQSPKLGCFGAEATYSIDTVAAVSIERSEMDWPARTDVDDETGEEVHQDAWTQVFPAWTGVVIS